MAAKLLEGSPIAQAIQEKLRLEIQDLKGAGISPHLFSILAGENPGALVYMRQQKKEAEALGIAYDCRPLPGTATEADIFRTVDDLNRDPSATGILLLVPLPKGVDARAVQMRIAPEKDVEGMNPAQMGRLVYGGQRIAPCTAMAAVELLRSSGVDLAGKEVTIVSHSEIIGKPVALLLLQSPDRSPTVTITHVATRDLAFHTRRADIVITAVGVRPNFISADMLKEGSIVIDVATIRVDEVDAQGKPVYEKEADGSIKVSKKTGEPIVRKKIVGDVAFEAALQKCSFISPVPGGVGPLTVTMLLKNTVEAAKAQAGRRAAC